MPVTSIYVILKELAFNTGAQSDPGIFNSIREYFKPHFINIVPVYFVSVGRYSPNTGTKFPFDINSDRTGWMCFKSQKNMQKIKVIKISFNVCLTFYFTRLVFYIIRGFNNYSRGTGCVSSSLCHLEFMTQNYKIQKSAGIKSCHLVIVEHGLQISAQPWTWSKKRLVKNTRYHKHPKNWLKTLNNMFVWSKVQISWHVLLQLHKVHLSFFKGNTTWNSF